MKVLLVAGHGRRYNGPTKSWIDDPGAVGNGTTERDFTRKTIVPAVAKYLKQAGHSVFLYGGTTMNQDMFGDTVYGNYIGNKKDYGLYWVKGEKYDVVVEFHLDAAGPSASGGHVIIPAGLNADNIDKGIQKVLESTVGTIRGISPRSDLLNCNVAKQLGINYRLVELGFITSKKDMDYLKANTDSFCKKIAEAINGKAIGTVQKKPVKKVVKKTVTTKPKPAPKKYQTYKVKKGDSLWKISQAFNVPVDSLVRLNAIKNNAIFIDQVIRIKEVSGTKQKKPEKVTTLNPIQYLVSKGLTVSSDPNTYKSGVWGLRNYTANNINYDAFCGGYHRAYDLYGQTGCAIPAVFDGEVVAGTNSYGNFGGTVVIANEKLGLQAIYGHLRRPIKLLVGQKVKQGDIIGYQGNTNYYNNPMNDHLHIQFQNYGYFANEIDFVCKGIDIKNVDVTKYPAVGLYK